MTDLHLLVDVRDGIAVLTMNRPDKRNALSPEMLVRLAQAWRQVRDDDTVRVAVLTGAGDKAFCAGADLGAGPRPWRSSCSASPCPSTRPGASAS